MENDKEEMSPMVSVLSDLTKSGYTTQFKATDKGICSMDNQKHWKPNQVEIKHFYRFEGESDPSDSSIVYAIETKTGEKGTLVDSYGAQSDPHVEKFIKEVESIKK
ncbi:MAG TPA: hypothetical protein VMZ69_09105 [Saprospiraceae bacterium]|nr:hypothetical protein [Saprospiraceae bacterium]